MNWKILVVVVALAIVGAQAPAENDLDGDWVIPIAGIPALTKEERNWIGSYVEKLEATLQELHLETIDRFSLCAADVSAQRSAGTLETLSVPYQVLVGDIKLLRIYAAALRKVADSKSGSSAEIARFYTQFRVRLALSGPLMREISVKSRKRDYGAFNRETRVGLREFQIEWIPSSLHPEEWETTIWLLIREDLETFLTHTEFVAYYATPSEKILIEKVATEYRLVSQEIGTGRVSREKGTRLLRALTENTAKIASKYLSLGETAEEHLAKVREFSAFVYFLGANHSVGEAVKTLELYYSRTPSVSSKVQAKEESASTSVIQQTESRRSEKADDGSRLSKRSNGEYP